MFILTSLATAHAACAEATTNAEVQAAVDAAMEAYAELDREAFERALRRAKDDVECLDEVVEPAIAAGLHRATGLSAFLARDEDLAAQRFAAARRIQPDFSFDDTLVPPGNPVRDLYQAFDIQDAPIEALAAPIDGTILLDGEATLDRRPLLPTVFQRANATDVLQVSVLLAPGVAPPHYRAVPTPDPDGGDGGSKLTVPLLTAAGVLAAGAIGTTVGAALSRKGYARHIDIGPDGAEDFFDVADSKRSLTNTLAVTGLGLGIAAAGTGAAGVVTAVF